MNAKNKNTKNKTMPGGGVPWTTALLSTSVLTLSAFGALPASAQTSVSPARANNRAGAVYSGMAPAGGTADLAGAMRRAGAMRQAARLRARNSPSQARASYQAAEASLSGISSNYSATSGGGFSLSAPQAAGDIRAIQSAARRARQSGQTREASRLRTMATRYAAGARAFFTGELREALFAPAALPAVVIRGDSRAAANARATAATLPRRRRGNTNNQPAADDASAAPLPDAASGRTPPPVILPANGPIVVNPPGAPRAPGLPSQPPIIVQDPGGTPDVIVQPPILPPAPPRVRP